MREYWFNVSDKIRFLLVGGFNALIAYLIYCILCKILGEGMYQYCLALSWFISSFISFFTQKFFVFVGGNNWFKEYLKCLSTWVFSYMINAFLLEVFVKYVHMNVFISQFIANFTAAVFTYIVFKKFAFKNKEVS